MKKIIFTILVAVLSLGAAMAQTFSYTNNVSINNSGTQGIQFKLRYNCPVNGNVDIYAFIMDDDLNMIDCDIPGYNDGRGHLCSYKTGKNLHVGAATATIYFPYNVLDRVIERGWWKVTFYLEDSDTGEILGIYHGYDFKF